MAKKKLTKKEKLRLAEAEAKKKAAEEEAERIRLKKEERERRKREAQEAKEREEREVVEQNIRSEKLKIPCDLFKYQKEIKLDQDIKIREDEHWKLYLKCDGLPNPAIVADMNTYLFLWRLDDTSNYIENSVPKIMEVLDLLDVLDNLIDNPLNSSKTLVENWKEIRNSFREEIQIRIDASTFNLLRNLEKKLEQIDLETVRYFKDCTHFVLCLWTLLRVPRAFNEKRVPPLVSFPEVGISVQLTPRFIHETVVIRALWCKYDHFSDLSKTWEANPLPEEYNKDLITLTTDEWEQKKQIKAFQEELETLAKMKKKSGRKAIVQQESECIETVDTLQQSADQTEVSEAKKIEPNNEHVPGETEPTQFSENLQVPKSSVTENLTSSRDLTSSLKESVTEEKLTSTKLLEITKSPSEIMEENEMQAMIDLRQYLEVTNLEPGEINMRRYTILGGVFHIDLLEQPPQPKTLMDRTVLTVLEGDYCLHAIDYHEEYVVASVTETEKLSEDSEADKKQTQDSEQAKLIMINISLPENVLWFEPPTAVQWHNDKKCWSTRNIYDAKFNDEKQILSFRTGLMLSVGLATFRFVNLPYQTWEMRPDWKCVSNDSVFLSITAATVIVEFIIQTNKICLNTLQNATGVALQDIVGTFYKPHKLIRLMKQGGVDLFPQNDAYLYIEGITPKHYVAENHLYNCLALLSTSYNFSWSRWNLLAGRKNMVMQIREYIDRKHLPNYNMLLVTPLRALIVDCTEVSQAFSHQGIEGMEFYPDLYMLVSEHGSSVSKQRISDIDLALVQTVYFLLKRTRILSYS